MGIPRRLKEQQGRFALVDGIPFQLPVSTEKSPALMAAFSINADKAKALLPGNELHPFRLWKKGLLVITVIDYRVTTIGKYIEFSIAIACTHGKRPAPRLLPGIFMKTFGTGQYVYDLPVSTEISVKGGKGIWGMPKHRAGLDFLDGEDWVSSQYDLDGRLAMRIDVKRPSITRIPISMSATNYCRFRGMLMASYIHLDTRFGLSLFRRDSARLTIGDHPRLRPIKELEIDPHPVFTAYFPSIQGVLDDHFECWFLSYDTPPKSYGEGMESVIKLGLSQEWPPAPKRENKEMN
ncbi:MAG TPA: acetoacetate decarboxylase family protein [Bradyrhizobium sp.]|nr:acetoacetate decarboxylase family protein [Burkholderiales bacterium]